MLTFVRSDFITFAPNRFELLIQNSFFFSGRLLIEKLNLSNIKLEVLPSTTLKWSLD